MFKVFKIQLNNAWLFLALFSLLSANILAVFIILLKLPLFSLVSAQPLFKIMLTYHVNLAMVFWMPIIACWLWATLFNLKKKLITFSIMLSVISLLMLCFSLFDLNNTITLSNYYPILHSYIFITSLIIQVVSVTIVVIAMLISKIQPNKSQYLAKFAGIVWLGIPIALIAYLMSHEIGFQSKHSMIEDLLWAPGHIQQTVNGLLIASMWCYFLKSEKPLPVLRLFTWLTVISCAIALVATLLSNYDGLAKQMFTWQMSLFSWLPMAAITSELLKQHHNNIYIKLSLFVGLLGVIAGTIIVKGTLSIPGHYHGMTGAFNLALFAILLNNLKVKPFQQRLTLSYGFGLIILIVGLTVAGYLGIGRKLVAQQQGTLDMWQYGAISFVAIGALVAITASLFIVKSFFPLLKEGNN
tara:strand:- start:30561 stop:31796 length:1236 start_codon:yes stop_codon:yes gene_type:complete